MIKLVTLLKRGPHLTRAEFGRRWLEVHAPIAAEFPNLRGYILGLSVEEGEPTTDGVAQLWFDDRAACQASYASDVGRNGSADASRHLSRRQHLLVSERWRRRGVPVAATPFKLLIAAKRMGDQPRADFVRWWIGPALAGIGDQFEASAERVCVDEEGRLLNSGTTGKLDLVPGEAVVDGLLELWFASEATARAAAAGYRAEGRPQLLQQVASAEDAVLREHVIVLPPAPANGLEAGH